MLKRLTMTALAVGFLALPLKAAATTITFGGPTGTTVNYSEAGFNFSGGFGIFAIINTNSCSPTCADNGTTYLGDLRESQGGAWTSVVVMTRADGGEFSFQGFDGAESFGGAPTVWAGAIRVTGVRADLTSTFADFVLDGINDGAGGVADFQTFVAAFSGTFINLQFSSNDLGVGDFSIDNVNVTAVDAAVPEPASLLLLGGGLAGLAALRRRKATRS